MIFFGRNVVLQGLKSQFKASTIFLDESLQTKNTLKIAEIKRVATEKQISIEYKKRGLLDKLANSTDHQGVLIDIEFHTFALKLDSANTEKKSFVYISESDYEHNIGAIIRSAESAGMSGVIIPKNYSISGTVAKTSAGAIFSLPIFKESIFNLVKKAKQEKYFLFGIERGGEKYYEVDLTNNSIFIIGGENKSLSDSIRKKCDAILEIPQFGKVNSLNMSVACSIILFERVRQLKL